MAAMTTAAVAAGQISLCPSLAVEQAHSPKSLSTFWGHSLSTTASARHSGSGKAVEKYGGPVCAFQENQSASLSRRGILGLGAGVVIPFLSSRSAVALLEQDEDEELLEKVKEAKKLRLAKQQEINDFNAEKSSVQKAVFKLSRAGQLLDESDYRGASDVLGSSLDADWIKDVQAAFEKVGAGESSADAAAFTSALSSLQTAVSNQDAELSKKAFVSSAKALKSWTSQAGFASVIKGL